MYYREKRFCIGTCAYVIIEVLLHGCFCLWGIDFMQCKIKPNYRRGLFYYIYLTYFYKDSCYNATLTEIFTSDMVQSIFNYDEIASIEFPTESPDRVRTEQILYLYILLDALLMITTLVLLVGVCINYKGVLSVIWYSPWLVAMGLVILIDMGVGSWYASHIIDTYGLNKWFRRMTEKQDVPAIHVLNSVYPRVTTAWPAIFMTLVFSKLLLFWHLNVCVFMFILQSAITSFFTRRKKKVRLVSSVCMCKSSSLICARKSSSVNYECHHQHQ